MSVLALTQQAVCGTPHAHRACECDGRLAKARYCPVQSQSTRTQQQPGIIANISAAYSGKLINMDQTHETGKTNATQYC
ncbi:hypothetical protein C7S18_02875 [Ahniella affigens]|uniref:Uncharacterized protein n=1 Tax=Ahniella affigens TaxID=2021234 RepID=A0A2P1PMZ3_9GAMM|nr:hypothetical protein C7S18_02875 [Ahniella affigens]